MNEWNRIEHSEKDPNPYTLFIYNNEGTTERWKKCNFYSKWFLINLRSA